MDEMTILRLGGYAAYAAAAASILSFLALFIFFAVGGIFGPINDVLSVFQMLFLIPVALALYQIIQEIDQLQGAAITAIGILGMLGIALLQIALVLGFVRFQQTFNTVLLLGCVIGVWFLVSGILILTSLVLPSGLGWVSVISGAAFVLIAAGYWLGGQQHPLTAIGFLAGAVAVPVWAIWFGRLLLNGRVAVPV